jgi:hypothetical protein
MRAGVVGALCLMALASAGPALGGRAHEHGVAQLDIGVEAKRVSLRFDTPLDALLGFERAPRTDAERQAADAAVAHLRDAGKLFRIDGAAGCKAAGVELTSAPLGLGRVAPAQPGANEGHGDLEAQFDFTCTDGARAGFIETGLFEAFPRLSRLELQIVTPRGQVKATLRRPNARVALAR